MSESKGLDALAMIQNAVHAEKAGVPVDWKSLAMDIYQAASTRIAELEATPDTESEPEPEGPGYGRS